MCFGASVFRFSERMPELCSAACPRHPRSRSQGRTLMLGLSTPRSGSKWPSGVRVFCSVAGFALAARWWFLFGFRSPAVRFVPGLGCRACCSSVVPLGLVVRWLVVRRLVCCFLRPRLCFGWGRSGLGLGSLARRLSSGVGGCLSWLWMIAHSRSSIA